MNGTPSFIPLMFLVMIYLLPTVIAFTRKHGNLMPIFLVNFFLGWTLIGWFVSLVWSTTNNIREKIKV